MAEFQIKLEIPEHLLPLVEYAAHKRGFASVEALLASLPTADLLNFMQRLNDPLLWGLSIDVPDLAANTEEILHKHWESRSDADR